MEINLTKLHVPCVICKLRNLMNAITTKLYSNYNHQLSLTLTDISTQFHHYKIHHDCCEVNSQSLYV